MTTVRKPKSELHPKIFHARMLVTRAEEWWVEAESAEEAEQLMVAGKAHRHALGELLHLDLEEILVEDLPESEED
jgi:hypothetical protein